MEFLELKALKILKKTMLSIISESELKIKKIENILDTYSKCYLCKEPYKENELRPIEKKELDKFKTYDEENPKIWALFVHYASKAKQKGFTRYGAKSLFEVIRSSSISV